MDVENWQPPTLTEVGQVLWPIGWRWFLALVCCPGGSSPHSVCYSKSQPLTLRLDCSSCAIKVSIWGRLGQIPGIHLLHPDTSDLTFHCCQSSILLRHFALGILSVEIGHWIPYHSTTVTERKAVDIRDAYLVAFSYLTVTMPERVVIRAKPLLSSRSPITAKENEREDEETANYGSSELSCTKCMI